MASVVSGWLTVLVNTAVEFGIHFLFYIMSMSTNHTNKIFRYLWSCENLHSTDNKIDRIFANASISKKV